MHDLPEEEDASPEAGASLGHHVLIEKAKATQEKYKAIQKGIGLTEKAGSFLHQVFGDAAEAAGGLLGDQLKYWRAANLNRLSEKWHKLLEARGVDPSTARSVPFGGAYRALEAASMEEDEDVQDLWARLLASAMDPAQPTKVKKVYVDLLKSIGPAEAAFLDFVWSVNMDVLQRTWYVAQTDERANLIDAIAARRWHKISVLDQKTAIQNLIRLRLVAYSPEVPNLRGLLEVYHGSGRRPRLELDPDKFRQLVGYLEDLILTSSGIDDGEVSQELKHRQFSPYIPAEVRFPELHFNLTPMGLDLMRACVAPNTIEGQKASLPLGRGRVRL